MNKEMTCIGCPMGCLLTVTVADAGEITVTGNTCPRGADYAKKEMTDPRRIVTSTVKLAGGVEAVVSCKTESDIPKNLIFECVKELSEVTVSAPVKIGDVVCANVANTGVNVIATKNVAACEGGK